MQPRRILAVDMGGTNIRAAIVTDTGEIVTRAVRPTPAQAGAEAVVDAITAACQEALDKCPLPSNVPLGMCLPGPLDTDMGRTLGTPTIAGFEDFPLRDRLQHRLGRQVIIDHDGHAAAVGEWAFGAAKGETNFIFLTISTGIGGCAVIDGRVIRGRRGLAGHFGHLLVGDPADICFCGAPGCWEATASGSAMQRRARASGFADLQSAFEKCRAGMPMAETLIDAFAHDIARGMVSLAHAFSPDTFVLGGGVMAEFDLLKPMIDNHFRRLCLPAFAGIVFRRAKLGDSAGLIGMAHNTRPLIPCE